MFGDYPFMLGHGEIVDRIRALVDSGVQQTVIAATMGLPPPRVSEILGGTRQVKIDEAKSLSEKFGWEQAEPPEPFPSSLSASLARLVVRHIAREANASVQDDQVEALAQDLRAFSEFVSDPARRERLELVEGMLEGRSSFRQEERL